MVNPCAAVWVAISPSGSAFLYREYYEAGRSVAQNALGIVEASGNVRYETGTDTDEAAGAEYTIYEEGFTNEHYESSVLDSRSFGTKSDRNCTLGALYNDMGLDCSPASGQRDEVLLPIMREWVDGFAGRLDFRDPDAGAIALMTCDADIPSVELCERVRINQSVLIVPGAHLGLEGFVRIWMGGDPDYMQAGLARVAEEFRKVFA